MKVFKYMSVDLAHMNDWLQLRGEKTWDLEAVPETGFVVVDDIIPVAIGFLRKVEGNMAMIDGVCTDPKAKAHVRHVALNLLTSRLIETAKAMKLIGLVAFVADPNTLERGEFFGFKILPGHHLVHLSLKDK
jgi:hypothetical protein